MVFQLLIGGAVAAGSYLFARKKRASTGQSKAVAAVTGAGAVGVAYAVGAIVSSVVFWPLVVLGGAAAGGYYYAKRKSMKELPAGRG